MDFSKIEKQIKKISFMLDTFKSEDEGLSSMERELLLDYTKKLYNLIKEETDLGDLVTSSTKSTSTEELNVNSEISNDKLSEKDNVVDDVDQDSPIDTDTLLGISFGGVAAGAAATGLVQNLDVPTLSEEPTIETIQNEIMDTFNPAPVETPVIEQQPTYPVTKEVKGESFSVPIEPPINEENVSQDAMPELFAQKEITDLSDRLSFTPITDLNKSMGINDRIRVVKELFGGDIELFKTTIDRLNKLNSYEEAKSYLLGGVARDYEWNDDVRAEKAAEFVKLIQRRFV